MVSFKKILRTFITPLAAIILSGSNTPNNNIEVDRIFLTSCVNNGFCSTDSKDITIEDKVKLNIVAIGMRNNRKVYFSDSDDIKINGRKINPQIVMPWYSGEFNIKWYKVESSKNSYNNIRKVSLNIKPGFNWDTPSYIETLVDDGTSWRIDADAHPTDPTQDINEGLGTMRYKVEFIQNGRKYSTPGKESVDKQGITKKVHRISFRKDNSFIGWLTSYFNLPYIYGSAGEPDRHQTDRFIGADCADLIVGAYRKAGHKIPYTNAAGLQNFADTVVRQENIQKKEGVYYKNGRAIKFVDDVRPGDLILFGDWHVGVITEDKSDPEGTKGESNGVLDKNDIMIHTLFDTPIRERIGAYGPFSILRLR